MRNKQIPNAKFQMPNIENWQKGFLKITKNVLVSYLIVSIALFSTGLIYLFNPFGTKTADAAWFNDNWSYRKAITVTTGSGFTNRFVHLNIDTTDAPDKFQADCGDIRFTSVSGDILSYYYNTASDQCDNAGTDFYVQFNTIFEGETVIYMYYGNSSAVNGYLEGDFLGADVVVDDTTFGSEEKGPSPLAYLKFNEGQGTTTADSTTSNNDGTINGADWKTEDLCISGKCLYFDGASVGGGGNPAFVQYSNSNTFEDTNEHIAAALPGPITEGNLLVFVLYQQDGTGRTFTWPAGYTQVGTANNTEEGFQMTMAVKIAGADEDTSPTVTWSGNAAYTIRSLFFEVSGADATTPMDVTPVIAAPGWTDSPWTSTGLTTATDNALHIIGFTDSHSTANTPPAGYAEHADSIYWFADKVLPTAGATGTLNVTKNSSGYMATFEMAVRPPAGGGGTSNVSIENTVSGIQTVSFWVKPNSFSSTTPLIDLNGTAKIIANGSGVISASGFTSPTIYVNGVESSALTAGVWQNVTVTTGTAISGSAIQIGTDGTDGLIGFVDEVKFYNSALSASQVNANYNARGNPQGIAGVLGTNTQNMPGALSNGLGGYWRMDESSSNATDSSGNGLTLTNNSSTAYADGKFGNAGSFVAASTDYFSTATTINGIKTVSFWTYNASTTDEYINLTSAIRITSSSGTVAATGFTSPTIYVNGVVNGTLTANAWHHVVITSETTTNANAFEIGRANSSYNNGKIDETRVYNRVLSSAEVSQLYNWAPGPVGYWKLDEGSGTSASDTSGFGNDLTLANSPVFSNAKFGKGVSLAGSNQHLTRSDDNDFDFGDDVSFSYEIWIKHGTVSSQQVIMSKYNEAGYKLIMESDGDLTCALDYDNTWTPTDSITSTAATYDDNNWHHIACIKDGASRLSLYIDGLLIGSDSSLTATNTVTNSDPLYIGIDADGTSLDFVGTVDEAKIYNYARTAAQIVESMNGGHPAPGSPVGSALGHWKFDEGADNTCSGGTNDVCNNGNAGNTYDGTSTATRSNDGKFNKALDFNGSTHVVTVANNPAIDMDGNLANFTFSGWINADSDGEADTGQIFNKGANTYLRVDSQSGSNLDLECNLDRATTDTNANVSTAFPISTWNHVACSWDGTTLSVYVNGILKASSTSGSGAISSDANSLLIGGGTSNNFDGKIDEFKVYSQAMTADQIKLDMNRGASQVFGAVSAASNTQPNSASNEYCPPDSSATVCTGPVGEWKLDEGSGTTANDSTGNANTGTITAGSGKFVNGKINKAYNFDGANTVINAGSGTTLDDMSGISLEAWIYPRSVGEGSNAFLLNKNSGNSQSLGWIFHYTSNQGLLFVVDGTTDMVRQSANSVVPLNQWSHIALSWNGTITSAATAKIFVNGKETTYQTTTNGAGRQLDLTRNLYIGNASTGDRTFDGYMDQIRVYNYGRTDAQVAWSYNKGGPIAHWKMDECQGTTINDASGNSYSGTLTNATAGTCSTSGAWFNGVSGKRNFSVDLDTDDYIQVTDNDNLRFDAVTADFSLFAWVKRASNGEMNVISKEDADNDGYSLQFTSGNVVRCSVDAIDIDSTLTITDTNWHLVGCTIDRDGNGQIYLDGVPNGSPTAISSEVMANTANLRLGARAYTAANYLDGLIDDTRIYNYSLSATQVKTLYNEGTTRYGPTTGAP